MTKKIAIVGASHERSKFGNKAVRAYLDKGWEVFPVNNIHGDIEGIPAFAEAADVPAPLDRISMYLPPQIGEKVVARMGKFAPAEIFFNPGSESEEAIAKARELGLKPREACSIVDIGASPSDYT